MPQQSAGSAYIRFISPQYAGKDQMMRRAGDVMSFLEHIPYPFDAGREVHADVILGDTCYSAVGLPPGPCVLTFHADVNKLKKRQTPGEELVEVSISDVPSARAFLEAAANASKRITYDVPVIDFVLPNAVLRRTDPDVDCDAPETWPHLFCSQFALLFLRHCHKHGLIQVNEPLRAKALYVCNSHVCSPAHLREIMRILLNTK